MIDSVAYIGNDNLLELTGLYDEVARGYVTSVTSAGVTVLDCAGEEVAGAAWPLDLTARGNGDFYAVLPDAIELEDGAEYLARVVIDDGADRKATFEIEFVARNRRS